MQEIEQRDIEYLWGKGVLQAEIPAQPLVQRTSLMAK